MRRRLRTWRSCDADCYPRHISLLLTYKLQVHNHEVFGNIPLVFRSDEFSLLNGWIFAKVEKNIIIEHVEQETSWWCWIASALMFVKHYFPDFGGVTRITQYNCAYYYFLRDQDYEGTVDDMPGSPKEAIDYYFNTEGYALPTIFLNGKIYEEKTIMQFIDDGHVLIINHRRYEKNGDIYQFNPDEPGHMYVLTGYVLINGNIWFVLLDPDTGLDGRTALLVTYDELCCSHETRNDPWFFWYATLVVDTEYANKTLPWKFPE